MARNLKAQVWVETAIYTLIGLTIIAILLSTATPQIQKLKDKGTIRQTIDALNLFNNQVTEARQAPGSVRIVNFKISKGRLVINPDEETIIYTLENTKLEFSEPGIDIKEGDIIVRTEENGARFNIILTLSYKDKLDLTCDETCTLQPGAAPYQIKIENVGVDDPSLPTNINIEVG